MNIKLVLDNLGILSLTKDVAVPLTYNLNDIRDISTRGGIWSKTVQIYGTNANNAVLGTVFDVNADTLAFNPKRKEPCTIVSDGMVIFEGIFQITKINKRMVDGNWRLVYDCYLKSDTSNFYTVIDGKFLTDIDLTEYNHTASLSVISDSMNNGNWINGYQYFLGWKPTGISEHNYITKDFNAGVYAKTYWDKIISNAGYTYEWEEEQLLNFDKLIIPYNGDVYKPYDDSDFKFRAGFSSQEVNITRNITYNAAGSVETNPISYLIFNNDNYAPENWYDYNGRYDVINGRYNVANYGGTMEFDVSYNADIVLFFTGLASTNIEGVGLYSTLPEGPVKSFYRIQHEITMYDVTNTYVGQLSIVTVADEIEVTGSYISSSNLLTTVDVVHSFVFDADLYPTVEYIQQNFRTILLRRESSNGDPFTGLDRFNGFKDLATGVSYMGSLRVVIDPQSSDTGLYTNTPNNYAIVGSPIIFNKLIPKKVTQVSFISMFVKMFNLYIYEDKTRNNVLIIKTRDKFYEDGTELDWSNKIHQESIDVELLSNSQSKTKLFTYKKDDKDSVLKAYEDKTAETFGQLEYVFDNDFIKDRTSVELIASPTILTNIFNKNLPYIVAEAPKNNIRVLFVGDLYTGFNYWTFTTGGVTTTQEYYRYTGHLYPNPETPEQDINFGLCDYYAHNYATITNNNLFNRFYRTQYDIFENGYLMSAEFNLNYTDISIITLAERIYCNNAWWNINKIIDFDPTKNQLTKVELISADSNLSVFIPNNNVFIAEDYIAYDKSINAQFRLENPTNTLGRGVSSAEALGIYNVIQPNSRNIMSIGDKNDIYGVNNLIVGSDNKVDGSDIIVLGKSNRLFNQPDTVNVGTLVKITDIVSAGRDEVINLYPTNSVINFISAGRDEVKAIGSETIESLLSAGRDNVNGVN
jgi:hypothetical protein